MFWVYKTLAVFHREYKLQIDLTICVCHFLICLGRRYAALLVLLCCLFLQCGRRYAAGFDLICYLFLQCGRRYAATRQI